MSRLPEFDPDALLPEQRAVYDAVVAKRGSAPAPHKVWVRNPGLARLTDEMGWYFQNHCSLPAHLYELTILLVARFWRAEYAWRTHESRAIKAGLPEKVVDALRADADPGLPPDAPEAVVIRFIETLQRERAVDAALYAEAVALLGEGGVIDLVGLMGYFTTLSATINVFEL